MLILYNLCNYQQYSFYREMLFCSFNMRACSYTQCQHFAICQDQHGYLGATIFVYGKMLYLSTFSTLSRASSLVNNEPSRRTLSYMINHICRDILRWGRNIVSSKTRTRKRAGIAVYNRASSLETLVCNTLKLCIILFYAAICVEANCHIVGLVFCKIGYLYLTNFKRLEQLMFQLGFTSGASSQHIADELRSSFQ